MVRLTGTRPAMLAALATILVLSLSGPAYSSGPGPADHEAPPADKIAVDVLSVNGSGCPAGTARVSVSPDNTHFRVTYTDYIARAGGGAGPTEFRKNCQLGLLIHIPGGFSFAIGSLQNRGSVNLKKGATALQRNSYYFQGRPETTTSDHEFAGPLHERFTTTDVTPIAALVWARCGIDRNFNINTELRVHVGSDTHASNTISMRRTDGDLENIFHFHWKRCR